MLIIVGVILWMILGLIISFPLALYFGYRLFLNRAKKIDGRYLD